MSTIYLSIRWSICCPFISLYVVLYSFTPTGGCPTFIKLQSGPKNLTLSSFGVCDWTRFHSSGRVSQPDSLPAPMTYDHRSTLRAPNCGLNGLKPAKRIGMDRLCYAVCLPNQVRNFWFLGHTHWNHWKQHQTTAAQSLATVPLALNSAVLVLWRGTA